ncbi:glycoside hydrolase family 15 protein [Aspergillus homomorphus CBS 101889]|uniref:glucan 1,4-alpha-glucosidase n=1 Tax=Aspergillus homomorphus (strain CBS 101889) TaxID=1450537 RepID=A0A395IDK0_ASPHC|nr:putative glucoamylase precursor [Aspergillus homomorphus CBS 101889]RAL16234.1 putative glucoamylase precursor [Aspergillus homomorphus CBS 101889]
MRPVYAIVLEALAGVPIALSSSHPEPYNPAPLNEFIKKQTPIAWQGILNNIGAGGAYPGIVVASPSKSDPDYFYTWTRDASLTITALTPYLSSSTTETTKIEPLLQDYITSQATQQTITNPSGPLDDGTGLAEPKFHVNLTAYVGAWGRPQRDGPALRASALIAYGNHLLSTGRAALARRNIWPIVRNDLAYVAQYWNETTFDLWEEVRGASFFTTAVQYRALVEGMAFAEALGEECAGCALVAPEVLCLLRRGYWDAPRGAVRANWPGSGRQGIDAGSVLAVVHTFDAGAGCGRDSEDDGDEDEDRTSFQPCSDRALANHKAVVDSFRGIYGVNRGSAVGVAAAVGRYAEDVYQGGHPWYLTTLAAAEQLYDALYQWERQGRVDVTALSRPFFADLVPDISSGSYSRGSEEYAAITDAVRRYADGFLAVVQQYTPENGSLAEQFDRNTGAPVSAVDLTWSYAAFLTAVARRDGAVPPSWGSTAAQPAPAQCSPTSVPGQYATPVVGSWRVRDELK